MEIIPAIDLLDGACVRLHQGDYDQVTRFSEDPVAQALSWQSQGATRLHLVDLDGAKRGEPINDAAVRAITAALDIPVQLGGGVRSLERAEELSRLVAVDRVRSSARWRLNSRSWFEELAQRPSRPNRGGH